MAQVAKQEVMVPEKGVQPTPLTPMDMIAHALDAGAGVEQLGKLMELQERWEKNQARKAFDEAMAAAKAEIPIIIKNKQVGFESKRTNERTSYRHEDMAQIARTVDPILARHGLSYRYRTGVGDGGLIEVACIISHKDGHAEETTLHAGRDETGSKNNLQAVGSTITYLQRYTLKAALGLSAAEDDDGNAADADPITQEQLEILRAAIDEVGADPIRFCKYMKIASLAELPAKRFGDAMKVLEQKRAKG